MNFKKFVKFESSSSNDTNVNSSFETFEMTEEKEHLVFEDNSKITIEVPNI